MGDFVAVKASKDHKAQQDSMSRLQQVQHQSLENNKFQTEFNKNLNVVRDQGVYPVHHLRSPLESASGKTDGVEALLNREDFTAQNRLQYPQILATSFGTASF